MSAVAAARARAVAIPAWAWVTGIVVVSAAVRIALSHRIVAPWIFVDELIYSELGKSFAAHAQFDVREVPSHGYGFVYPVLIAPAWRIFGPIPQAYAAAKAIGAVAMSLTAVPAYFLARRLLTPTLAVVVAVLSVAIPSMLYTGTLMTETVFYPLFVLTALALLATLERPTRARQLGVLVLCGVAFAARAQAVALVPAVLSAPILLAWIERRGLRRGLRPFALLYGVVIGVGVLAILGEAARGRSPLALLGAYKAATDSSYTVGGVLHFVLYHVAELDLYVGVVPFAALLALWFAPRAASPAARAFAAASASLVAWLVLEVAAFASQRSVDRIEERNIFYLAPLALVPLAGLAADGVVPRRRRAVLAAALVAGLLPAAIPFDRFITTSAVSDTFALLPWWWVQDHLVSLDAVRWVALAVSLAAAALLVAVPRRFALVLAGLVAAYFVASTAVAENGRHGIHQASVGSLWAGIRVEHPDWIDRAVGRGADVAVLWSGKAGAYTLWENEFFNRSVGRVYDLGGVSSPGGLPETNVARRDDGRLVRADGSLVRSRYVLTDSSVSLAGTPVARDPRLGIGLFRARGPLTVLTKVTGLYPGDTWSGRSVTYTRVQCTGGRLSVLLGSDPSLFRLVQVVVARVGGAAVGRAYVTPDGQARLGVPLHPTVAGRCVVRFDVVRTAVPTRVLPGSADNRVLGAHFLRFDFHR